MNYKYIDFLTDFVCLQKGIIHFTVSSSESNGSIDDALASLTPEEARRARRKFRKQARQCMTYKELQLATKGMKRRRVMTLMRKFAWDIALVPRAEDNLE
jgi:hypothetical protein